MRSGWLRCVCVVGSLAAIVSCGSSSKSALVYIASQGSVPGTISTYKLDLKKGTLSSDNGALKATGKSVDTGTQPTVMIFDPANAFAFVADFGSPLDTGSDNGKKNGDVAVFSIGKDGALASVGITALAVDDCLSASPVALAMDQQGKFLFVANQTFYNVNNGASCPPGNPSNGTPGPGFLSAYPVSSGTLGTPVTAAIPVPAGPPGTNLPYPSALAVANGLNFVYVTDEVNNTVAGFAFDSNGALSSVPGQFYKVGTTPRALLSPPVGTFLYVGNAGSNDIYELFINADGSLMPITNSTTIVSAGVGPIAMLTDPNAKYLLALANGGSQISSFTINRVTGALSATGQNGNVVSTGANPVAFTIRSDGSTSGNYWVFTSNFGGNSVSSYSLNGSTGTLSALPQLTAPVAPYGITTR